MHGGPGCPVLYRIAARRLPLRFGSRERTRDGSQHRGRCFASTSTQSGRRTAKHRVDEGRITLVIGEPIGRADAAYVKARTGFSIGGVAPLGHLSPPITLFDETLLAFDVIYPAAGHPNTGFAVNPRTLASAAQARILRVC